MGININVSIELEAILILVNDNPRSFFRDLDLSSHWFLAMHELLLMEYALSPVGCCLTATHKCHYCTVYLAQLIIVVVCRLYSWVKTVHDFCLWEHESNET